MIYIGINEISKKSEWFMYNRNDLRRKINQRWIQLVEIGVLILVMNPPILDVWFRLLQERNELRCA